MRTASTSGYVEVRRRELNGAREAIGIGCVNDGPVAAWNLIQPVVLGVTRRIESSGRLRLHRNRRSDRGSAHQAETKLAEERTPGERARVVV